MVASGITGAKSVSALYGGLLKVDGVTVCEDEWIKSV